MVVTLRKERAFKKKETVQEAIFLRLQGWPLDQLAFKYGCDKTSVRKMLLKYHIPTHIILLSRPIIVFRRAIIDFNGERLNPGKTYQELLEEQRKRQRQQRKSGVA